MATKKKIKIEKKAPEEIEKLMPKAPGYLTIIKEEPEILHDTANSVKIDWHKVFDIYNKLSDTNNFLF